MSEYDQIIEALEAHGSRRSGVSGWQCPAHDDRVASLSVNERNGKALLYCQAGCDTEDVLRTVGTSWRQLRPQEPSKTSWIAKYEYTDERGAVMFVKERGEPKTFRVYRPLTGGRRQYRDVFGGAKPPRRVLYRLPAVVAAIAEGRPVYLVEGEKDVAAAERAGVTATCNYEGAATAEQRPKWRPEYGDMLEGAHVVIVADNDQAGRAHAEAARRDLDGKATSVRVVRGAVDVPKADLSDHLAAGHGIEDLVPVDEASVEPSEVETERLDPETMSSKEYFEACVHRMHAELLGTDDLDKIPELEPLVGDLLAMNTLSRIIGPSGTFKSFVLLDLCGSVGTGLKWHGQYVKQGTVVYLVAEGEQGVRKRVRAWEQHHGVRMDNVRFLPRPVQAMSPEWDVLVEVLRQVEPVLIAVDTQARVTVGVEENSAKEMGQVIDRLDKLRTATGACVALVHHTGHIGEHGRGSSAVKGSLQSEINVKKTGDKLSNIVLTVKASKQKDEDQDDDRQFRMVKVALVGEAKPDGRPVTSLVLESLDLVAPEERAPAEGTSAWIVWRLDEAGVPNVYSRRKLADECQKLGFRASNDKLQEAANLRKQRSADWSYSRVAKVVPEQRTTSAKGAGESGPGPLQDQTETSGSGLVVPSSSLGRGPQDHSGPICTGCHQPLDAFYASHGNDRHPGC